MDPTVRFALAPATNAQARSDRLLVFRAMRAAADGGPSIRVPTADDTIEEGDRLVVAGTRAAVESLDVLSG